MLYRSYHVPDEPGRQSGRTTLEPLHTPEMIVEAILADTPTVWLRDIIEQLADYARVGEPGNESAAPAVE